MLGSRTDLADVSTTVACTIFAKDAPRSFGINFGSKLSGSMYS